MAMIQQSASSSSGAMMQDVDAFREKLEVLPPEVLANWLAENQEHPLAYVGLGVQAEYAKHRAAGNKPTSTVLQDQLGGQGMTGLPMPMGEGMTPEMAAGMVGGVNTPQDMSRMVAMRPGIERGVSNLPVPNTMYGNNGGIVGFANGDLVGDPAGPSYWDQAKNWAGETFSREGDAWHQAGNVANFLVQPESYKDMGRYFMEDPAGIAGRGIAGGAITALGAPTLGAVGALGLGALKYGGRFIPGRLAREVSKMSKKDIADAWFDSASKIGARMRRALSGKRTPDGKPWPTTRPPGAPGATNKAAADAITSALGRQATVKKVAGVGLAGMAASEIQEILTDPRYTDEQKEQMLANAEEAKAAEAAAAEAAAAEAAAAEAAGPTPTAGPAAGPAADPAPDDKVPPKRRDISEKNMLLMELGLGMLGDTDTTGGALGSLGRSGGSALKSLAVRKAAKADREFKQATLDLQKKSLEAETRKMDLVYDAAIRNSGMSQKELMTLRATFQDKEYPQILADARAKLTAMNDENWFFNRMSTSELNAEAKKLADAEAEKIFQMRQITSLIGVSGISGLASLSEGAPSADGFSARLRD